MNYEMLYTMAIGNSRSYFYLWIYQLVLYITALNMTNIQKGIINGILLSVIASLLSIISLSYLNSDMSVSTEGIRKINTIEDKKKAFKKVSYISFAGSFTILMLLYFAKVGVADYFIYSGPLNIVFLFVILGVHDSYLNTKYNKMKNMNWVFDYKKNPQIRTAAVTTNTSINMFDEKNKFLFNDISESITVNDVFSLLPPGTLLRQSRIKKPSIEVISFNDVFQYNGLDKYKNILLPKSNVEDIKKINVYKNVISKYTNFYSFIEKTVKCSKVTLNVNGISSEYYVKNNEYIKKYVNATDVELEAVSLKMRNEIIKLNPERFFLRNADIIDFYNIKLEDNKTYLSEIVNGEEKDFVDVSYLQKYMSLSLNDYYCTYKGKKENEDKPLEKHLRGNFYKKSNSSEEIVEKEKLKTLYKFKIKEVDIYAFKEDFRRIGEVDEMIIDSFINQEIKEALKSIK